jgi:PAS domain S-box-containing protein
MKNASFASRLRLWLNNIPIQEPVQRPIAALFQVILIGLMAVIVLATLLLITIPLLSVQEKLDVVKSDLFGLLVVGLPLILLRRGYFRGSVLIIISILFITPALAITVVFDLLNSGGILFQFTLAILLAGLLVSRRALVFIFMLSVGTIVFSALRGLNTAPQLAIANMETAINFILFNGLIALFLDRFAITLRAALKTALERESELKNEINERRQAEAELRQSEERYRKLIDSARDVIFTIATDGTITYLNPAFEVFTGWSRTEWFGRAFDELVAEPDRGRARDQFQRILHGETLRALRINMSTRSGEILVVEMNISPQFKAHHVLGLLGIARDMTQEQRAEEALRVSEARYRHVLDTMMEGCQIIDFDWRYLYVNEVVAAQQAHLRQEEMLNHTVMELYPGVENTELFAALQQCMEGRLPTHLETPFNFPDGRLRWFELSIQPVQEGIFILSTDSTERRQAQETIRASHELFQKSFQASPIPTMLSKLPARTVVDSNSAFEEVFEFQRAELAGRSITEFDLWVDAPEGERVAEVLLQNGRVRDYEFEFKTKSGRIGYGIFYAEVIEQQFEKYLLTEIMDITERKRTEAALRELQSRQQKILDTMFAFVGLFSPDGILLEANRAPLEVVGVQAEDVIGKPFADGHFWAHSEATQAQVRDAIRRAALGETVRDDFQLRVADNQLITVDAVFSPLHDSSGNVIQVVGSSVDITDRKRAEEKIQRQNQRLKALREIDTAILSADSVKNIVDAALSHIRELIECRRANLTLIDRDTNEVVIFGVRTVGETSIPRGRRLPLAQFKGFIPTLLQNQPILFSDFRELADPGPAIQALLHDGLRSTCSLPLFSQGALIGMFSMHSEIPAFFDEEKIGLGREVANQVAIAITQSRLIEALQQRASEREALITELTAKNAELERFTYTVSHDLKSPLVTMKGFLGYLEQDMVTGNMERLKGDMRRIANAVEKMQELLNDLLELSRIGRFVNPPENISLEELARSAMELVDGRLKERGVTVQIQPDLPIVYGDRQRLTEILQNLVDNAAKYMGSQPAPIIEVGQRGEKDGMPVIYVKDNGTGIPVEYHDRIFGLFNKLDALSEGTGIGLALVKRIVEYHGGQIWVESEERRGTTFFFTLQAPERADQSQK